MDPIWQRVVVAAVAPVLTAALALFVVNRAGERVQTRRDAFEVREKLAAEMSEVANALYFALQSFYRAAAGTALGRRRTDPATVEAAALLDEAYTEARVRGQSIEGRLRIYYADPAPAQAWHRVSDLMSARYFLLLEADADERRRVRDRNAGADHSGLDASQLNDPSTLLREIRQAIPDAVQELWRHDVDRRGRHLRHPGALRTWHDSPGDPDSEEGGPAGRTS